MTRLGAVFWVILVLATGFATFKAKSGIQDLEDELAKVRKQTVVEQGEIRVLNAEWTFLNQPERLADLNKRFLNLAPIAAKQLQQRIEDIALRAPAAAPDLLVDAAPAPTPPAAAVAAPVTTVSTTATVTPVATVTPAVSKSAAPRLQLAKAGSTSRAGSLDALIAQIAETR